MKHISSMPEHAPATPKDKKVVFIMGSGHSGSTLLDLTLGSHSWGFSLGEFSSLSRLMKDGKLPLALCKICGEECKFWNKSVSIPILESYFRSGDKRNKLAEKIYDRFGSIRRNIYNDLFEWTGSKILIDSSKSISWIRRQLLPFWHWVYQKPFLIYICRDGRAIVNSYLRKYPDKNVKDAAKGWVRLTEKMEQFFDQFPSERRTRISYESLATQPDKTLSSLCNFLGVVYEPEMLQYWMHDHHVLHSNSRARSPIVRYQQLKTKNIPVSEEPKLGIHLDLKWKQELSSENLEIFETIAGNLNRHYAYEEK